MSSIWSEPSFMQILNVYGKSKFVLAYLLVNFVIHLYWSISAEYSTQPAYIRLLIVSYLGLVNVRRHRALSTLSFK